MARADNFDLAGALASPSFTPAQKDAPALVELVVGGEEPAAQRAAGALAKLGDAGRKAVDVRLAGGAPTGADTSELGDASTARLVGVIGLLARAGDAVSLTALVERTRDAHVRVRRAAISALGKVRGDVARDALVARWDAGDVTPDERRALVEALGKIGGADVLARLQNLETGDDAELQRRSKRAKLMVTRTAGRDEASTIKLDETPAERIDVVLRSKVGLAPLLVEELRTVGIQANELGDGALIPKYGKPWSALHAARLWITGAFVVPLVPGDSFEARIEATLGGRAVRGMMESLTQGPIRYRIGFPQGHRRSLVWRLADQMQWLVNDPIDTTWDILADDKREVLQITPRKAVDPRFTWRVAEVPAASHPTVAAALAFIAGTHASDRVWDPFVGSGLELIERARKGPFQSLLGTDLDDAALEAARKNVESAGVAAQLVKADARTHDLGPGEVDLIITNPPLGSRVQLDAAALLVTALPHFARVLSPKGRLVWITPSARQTAPVAEANGLRRTRSIPIDLGGVRGQLERWER